MKNVPEPTQMSDHSDPVSDPKSLEATLGGDQPQGLSEETLPLDAPEATFAADHAPLKGPLTEPTQAFLQSEVPPGSVETLLQDPEATQLGPEATVAIGQGARARVSLWGETTDFGSSGRPVNDGETLDSQRSDQTTEFADFSGQAQARPSGSRPSPLRGAPGLPGYTILAEIGRGGMGVVYKAWHIRLDRPVALKMILAGAHASSDQLERFKIEAQAIAQIQDPGIVQIYDVGEQDGLPFFSLEFVAGGALDKKIGGRPQPPTEAASMVRKLALAMNQAHLRKIIHRDLKPANVLLTPEGEPKITDFGLAKRLEDDSHQTRSGAIMGTPSYMAPEQAWGQTREIGTHTDQYALGTILYEMLVGHVPFQGATALETLELARTQEPIAPRRLQPKIPVDLETICLKCLQKESAKRYPDVATLAEELDRYLKGQPILARPIGRRERAIRWCQRNPRVAGLLGAVAVLLMTVSIGSTAFAFRLNTLNENLEKSNEAEKVATKEAREKQAAAIAAKDDADKSRVKEAEARAKAETALAENRKLADGGRKQNLESLESYRVSSILVTQRLSQFEGTQKIIEELIQTSMKGIESNVKLMEGLSSILKDSEGELLNKRTLAGTYQRAGRIADQFERYDEAIQYFEKMDKMATELVAIAPNDVRLMTVLAVSKGTLGGFQLDRMGNGKEAFELFQQTLKIRREILRRQPNDNESKRGVANALGAIARSYLKLGEPEKTRELYREEVALRDEFSPEFAAVYEVRRERSGLEEKLGDVCLDLNDLAGARKSYDQSLVSREKAVHDYPDDTQAKRDVFLSIRKLATLDLFEHKSKEARTGYEKALADFQRRLKTEPNSLALKQDVAVTEYYVATACLRLGDPKAADEHYRASLAIREKLATDPRLKLATIDLMIVQARCGFTKEAAETAKRLCEKPPLDARIYYQAACGFSLCAGNVKESATAGQYTDDAIKALRLAKTAGWKNLGDLQNDPDLDPIRNDPGFTTVFQEFRDAAKP